MLVVTDTVVGAEFVVGETDEEKIDDEESLPDCDVFLLLCEDSPPPTPPPIVAPKTNSIIAKAIQNIRRDSPHIRGDRGVAESNSATYGGAAGDLVSLRFLESTSSP
jgi:hypothetical protein